MKLKFYRVIFIVLIVIFIIISILLLNKQFKSNINEEDNKQIVEEFFESNNNTDTQENVKFNGYNVIGIVKISKIGIEYPILDINVYNPEETKEPMEYSIVKYWGGNVNEYGNLSIAGHNKYNGTMFGKTKSLKIGDIVELTDTKKITVQYEIYSIFVTDPNDISILETKDANTREVTLITCTNGNRQRLILKAREKI